MNPSGLDLNILAYEDYRLYLTDFLAIKRSRPGRFSVRQFCVQAGLSTENYLLRILRRERNLGPKVAERFIVAMPLKGIEARYFLALVYYEGARTVSEKKHYLTELSRLRRRAGKPPISLPVQDNSFFRHWYICVIYELISCRGFVPSTENIAHALTGRVSVQEIKEALDYLFQNGYLARNDDQVIQTEKEPRSSDGTPDPIMRLNHHETTHAALNAIELPIDQRGFFGLTIAINKSRLSFVKDRLRAFIHEIHSDLAGDTDADAVFRIGAHCFSLAETLGKLPQQSQDSEKTTNKI